MSGAGFQKGMEQLGTIGKMYNKLPPEMLQKKTTEIIGESDKRGGGTAGMDKAITHSVENSKQVDKKATTAIGKEDGGAG